jgi:hypothetical protein
MGFASTYLEERVLFPAFIKEAPDNQTGIIVVVPAYNEPDITILLDSLAICSKPDCGVEIIVVVNAPACSEKHIIENNQLTIESIERWKGSNNNCFFRLYCFITDTAPFKEWGVGLARKTGMDEAVRRFDIINNPEGVILSLDADCTVEHNYFVSICDGLLKKKERSACSIYFEHPLSEGVSDNSISKYITLYELHLRYYLQGIIQSGFPYAFHTVGSSVAVKALPYIRAGGMNRRQAGEDFYFIQKLAPSEGYFSLNSTTVYPSSRVSSRVPFGTGASIGKLTDENSTTLLTYNLQAFKELRIFFGILEKAYNCSPDDLMVKYKLCPPGIKLYIAEQVFMDKLLEIKNNTSNEESFKKRFYGWFNMFRIVKYLNYTHLNHFKRNPVELSAAELIELQGITCKSKDPVDLLFQYRLMERKQ